MMKISKNDLGNLKNHQPVYLASDHGGFKIKEKLFIYLFKKGYTVVDFGPHKLNIRDDYPDFVAPMAKKVVKSRQMGIAICRNGQGACIAANKVKGVRAVTGFSKKMIKSTRADDNSNILCIPSDYVRFSEVKKIVDIWLETPFSKLKRHVRRLDKVRRLEK